MTERVDAEAVRRAALAHLGVRDERAREILARARVVVVRAEAGWEASHGDIEGHVVRLGTDPRSLGEIAAHPAIHDALCEALAAGVASHPRCAMTELETWWALAPPARSHGYRTPPSRDADRNDPRAIGEAVVAYFEGSGERELAREAGAARVALAEGGGGVAVVVGPDGSAAERIAEAVRGLVAGAAPASPVTVIVRRG